MSKWELLVSNRINRQKVKVEQIAIQDQLKKESQAQQDLLNAKLKEMKKFLAKMEKSFLLSSLVPKSPYSQCPK